MRSVVNGFSNELASMDILYAINAKKEPAALLPRLANKSAIRTGSTISISELLDYVNEYFPDILPEDVLKHYGHDARPDGVLGESALYSSRNPQKQQDGQKNTAPEDVKLSVRDKFYKALDNWDGKTIGFSFIVGNTSAALQKAGMPQNQIRWDASKISTLLKKHNGMTIEIVRKIPELLENPIVVIDSKKNSNSRIVMGDLYDEHGKIVTAVVLLTPTSKKGNILDFYKISSAEGRSHIKSLFANEDGTPVSVRYVDRKRIQSWLNVNRLQLPLHNLDLDPTASICDGEENVKEQFSSRNPQIVGVTMMCDSDSYGNVENRRAVYTHSHSPATATTETYAEKKSSE